MNTIYRSAKGKEEIQNLYRSFLSQWDTLSETRIINTSFGKTHLIETGDSNDQTVMFLHGSSTNSAMWLNDIKQLTGKFHIIAVDIPGECGLSCDNRLKLRSDNHSKWLLEICNKLKLSSISIVGNSLGGWIGLDFAHRYSDRVKNLIVIAPGGLTNIKPQTIVMLILTSILGSFGFKLLSKLVYRELKVDKKVAQFSRLVMKHFIPRTEPLPIFKEKQLKLINAKLLFIGGEYDCFYNNRKSSKILKRYIENIEIEIIKDCGHVIINQAENIDKFLAQK